MRVVSLVPSWTETLLEAGVDVVGRTRFCIHEKTRVASIPRVGGTKDWQWPKIQQLKPDLLILDREENPKWMSEQNEIKYHASEVKSVGDMPSELERLALILKNKKLADFAEEWRAVLRKPKNKWDLSMSFPGLIDWGQKPTTQTVQFLYLIWKDPWMSVGQKTFIASVCRELGIPLVELQESYPKLDLANFDPASTGLLFSSEPFPFLKHRQDLVKLGFSHGYVDGEKFSWFGTRSLRFLQMTKS